MPEFKVVSEYTPSGDQPQAIEKLAAGLEALNPRLQLCLIVLPATSGARAETRASHALLAARAADWARDTARVRHDPVLDALVGRLLAPGGAAADPDPLAALVVRLCGGADLRDLLAQGATPPAAAAAAEAATEGKRRTKDPERRARRKARAEAKGKGKAAKVMCEDELLEAFSK